MRLIRSLLTLLVIAIIGVLAYNYWSGNGLTLHPAVGAPGIDADAARQQGSELASKAASKASQAATQIEEVLSEGSLSAKIKSKMMLDDYVKARTINVTTNGTVVTLTGNVRSAAERERAVRLARETKGVTNVVDKLEIK